MSVSAEIRWFWLECPENLRAWFHARLPSPGLDRRDDEYLHEPGQTELGIKRRGGKPGAEIKGLVTVFHRSQSSMPFVGPIEIWCKWRSPTLTLQDLPMVKTKKSRWLRKFDMTGAEPIEIRVPDDGTATDQRMLPNQGCNVELTQIELPSEQVWWTFGFEAFGDLSSVEQNLQVAVSIMAERDPPPFVPGDLLSYPAWLDKYARP